MFKRLSKANALREQGGEDQEHVSLDAAIDHDSPSEEEGMDEAEDRESTEAVSYTHLTLPTSDLV